VLSEKGISYTRRKQISPTAVRSGKLFIYDARSVMRDLLGDVEYRKVPSIA